MAKTPKLPGANLKDIDPKMITNPKVKAQIEAEQAKSGGVGSAVGDGLKSAVKGMGETLFGSLPKTMSGSFKTSAEDAKETGKTSPSTGDVGKDTINAIRDLQSDFNTQTGVLRQTNGILESQSKLMAEGFNNLASQISKIKGGAGGGGPPPFNLFDPTTWFNKGGGKGGGEGAGPEKTKIKPEERYKFNEKANRWMDTEKGVGGGKFMSDAEATAKGFGKGGTRTPVSEGFFSSAKNAISSGVETATSSFKSVAKFAGKHAPSILMAGVAVWDGYEQIKKLNPADPNFNKQVTEIVAGLIAEFGLTSVASIIGGIIGGALTGGPGSIPGFIGGLAAGMYADIKYGDNAKEIATQIIEFLWPKGAAPVAPVKPNKLSIKGKAAAAEAAAAAAEAYIPPERITHARGLQNAKNAEFDVDTGKQLSKKEIEEKAAAAQGEPIYDAMGNFTGMSDQPKEGPSLNQKEAGRNKFEDKKLPPSKHTFHYEHYGSEGTSGSWDFEDEDADIARKIYDLYDRKEISQDTLAAALNAILYGQDPYKSVPELKGGKKDEKKTASTKISDTIAHESATSLGGQVVSAETGKTPAMAELARKEEQRKTEQFQQQIATSVGTGATGAAPSTTTRPALPSIPTAPKSAAVNIATPTSPQSAAVSKPALPTTTAAPHIPPAGGAAERKETRDKKIIAEKASGNAAEAMRFFMSKGWSKEQAAGIVGNLKIESGNFSQDVISGKRRGDNGKAVGVAQWHPDRQARFKQLFGKDITESSFVNQLEFLNWELNNTERKAGSMLMQARDAGQAAAIFDQFYERSSGAARSQRIMAANSYAGTNLQASAEPVGGAQAGAGLGGDTGMGTSLKSKETAALSSAMGQSQSTAPVSSAAATRDAVGMTPPSSGKATPTVNASNVSSSGGGKERPSNKVEAALPSAKIFHELFGIGAGGKGSTSFAG